MQASERYRLMELYRNETAGRVGLGVKCGALASALAVIVLVASGAGDRAATDTQTPAVAGRADDGIAYQQEAVVDDRRAIAVVVPRTAP